MQDGTVMSFARKNSVSSLTLVISPSWIGPAIGNTAMLGVALVRVGCANANPNGHCCDNVMVTKISHCPHL